MSTQTHDSSKAPSDATTTPQSSQLSTRPFANSEQSAFVPIANQFQSRPFAIQAKSTSSQQEATDIQTQLEQAQRFGYDLANIPVFASSTPSPTSPTASVIQPKLAIASLQPQSEQMGYPIMRQDMDAGVATTQSPQPTDAGPVAGVPTDTTADQNAIPEDLQAFRNHGPYPGDAIGQTITPESGMGGFNARYDPASMTLSIIMNIAMTFVDGVSINGNRFVANDPGLQPLVDRANRLRGAARQQAMERVRNDWQWHGQEDAWMETYKQSVSNAWSQKFAFQSTKPGWQTQLANVQVVINTSKVAAPAGPAPAPPAPGAGPIHCQARILKTRDDNTMVNAEVGAGDGANATDQTLTLGSGQAISLSQNLTTKIWFPSGSAQLQPAERDTLRRFIISYQAPAGSSGTSIEITGRANTKGGTPELNQQLSEQRANAVANFLRSTTVEGHTLANAATRIKSVTGAGTTGADENSDWRRVDIVVAGGQGQNVAAHEFGHMIGLDDEYASTPKRDKHGNIVTDADGDPVSRGLISGTGGDVGDTTAHNALSQRMGLGGSVAENNDNIMSLGNTIRPQHYATFMQALHNVTGMSEWGPKS